MFQSRKIIRVLAAILDYAFEYQVIEAFLCINFFEYVVEMAFRLRVIDTALDKSSRKGFPVRALSLMSRAIDSHMKPRSSMQPNSTIILDVESFISYF